MRFGAKNAPTLRCTSHSLLLHLAALASCFLPHCSISPSHSTSAMAASPRIAVLQLSPAHGAPLENAARVQQMTSQCVCRRRSSLLGLVLREGAAEQLTPAPLSTQLEARRSGSADLARDGLERCVDPLLVRRPSAAPLTLSVSGYIFPTPASIEPSLERLSTRSSSSRTSSSSPTQALCSSLARRLECYVLCGLPALLAHAFSSSSASSAAFDARPSEPSPSGSGRSKEGEEGAYNAALLLDRTGEAVHVFRKHFLYEADEAWACEGAFLRLASLMSREETDGTVCNDAGPGFEFVDLPKPLGRVSCTFLALESSSRTLTRASSQLAVGICMDLNRACPILPLLSLPSRPSTPPRKADTSHPHRSLSLPSRLRLIRAGFVLRQESRRYAGAAYGVAQARSGR